MVVARDVKQFVAERSEELFMNIRDWEVMKRCDSFTAGGVSWAAEDNSGMQLQPLHYPPWVRD